MRNFRARGEAITITAVEDIASGAVVVIGSLVGVAAIDIPAGEEGVIRLTGVYWLPKAVGEAWAVGDAVSWDEVTEELTVAGGPLVGAVVRAASPDMSRALVRLNGAAASSGSAQAVFWDDLEGMPAVIGAGDDEAAAREALGLGSLATASSIRNADVADDAGIALSKLQDVAAYPDGGISGGDLQSVFRALADRLTAVEGTGP